LFRCTRSLEKLVLLLSVGSVILLVPLRGASESLPILSFAAVMVLFMIPGVLSTHWFLRDEIRGPAVVPVGFAISTGLFGLLGIPVLISHASIEVYLWAAGTVLAAFLLAAAWRTVRGRKAVTSGESLSYGLPAGRLWAPFALLGGALAFVATRRVPNDNDDIWVYLSWVRDFASAERLALREPYFSERVGDLSRVQINGWLLEQAALCRVSGLDTIGFVLRYLTPTLVIVTLLAVYALARTLLKSERAAVLTGSVYALFHIAFMEPSVHNIGVELAVRVSEDKHAARFIVLPIALLFAVLFVRTRKTRHLAFFAFFCWAMVAVHPVVLLALGLCMLGFGVAHVAADPRRRTAWTGMAALALALWSVAFGPALILFAGESPAAVLYSSDINSTPPKVLDATVFVEEGWRHIYAFDDGSYMMHPWLLLNPVILGTYALGVPFLLWRMSRSVTAQFLLGGLAAVTVAVYVPPVATFVGEELIAPGQLWRLSWPIPLLVLLTAGWVIWEMLRHAEIRLSETLPGRDANKLLPLALVVALTAAAAPPSVAKAVGLYREHEVARTANYHPDPVYPWIQDNIKEPGVLLARDSANTAMPAYSTSLDVVSLRGEAMIRDREELERVAGSEIDIPRRYQDVHDFFYGTTPEESQAILRRHGVDYVMVYAGGPLDERLETLPGFSAVEDAPKESFSLYAVDLRKLGKPVRLPPDPARR
jgi:hypothetical protein